MALILSVTIYFSGLFIIVKTGYTGFRKYMEKIEHRFRKMIDFYFIKSIKISKKNIIRYFLKLWSIFLNFNIFDDKYRGLGVMLNSKKICVIIYVTIKFVLIVLNIQFILLDTRCLSLLITDQ